jgi:outer membrane protein insertion porin family
LTDIKHEDVSSNEIYGSVATVFGGSTIISSSNVSPFLLQGGQINSLTLRGIQDTRDLPLNPRTGTFDELTVEPGTGTFHNPGDTGSHLFNYLRLSADLRKYIGVGAITHKEDKEIQKVLAMRLLYGRTSSGVPAFEYFFLGGADTLRGYNDDNFFGQNLLLGSLELRVPIALDKLQWVAFVDAGDSWGGNYTADTGMRLYPDAGAGVRVIIPSIGPLRLDYAYGSYGPRLQFSIGQTF